jgi:quercetin dioxygenase-like cupin family protein
MNGGSGMNDSRKSGEGLTPAEVVTVDDLVQYQDSSIVSRTIVSKTAGTVTVFAFEKGQGLSEHSAPFDALVVVLDGTGEITISGKPYRVAKGQALLMPADEPHSVSAVERFKMMLVMIKS